MTFDDYRDKIIASLAAILAATMGYVSIVALNAASKSDVQSMISEAKESWMTPTIRAEVQSMINESRQNSFYMQDKNWISGNIQELHAKCANLTTEVNKNREMVDTYYKQMWHELSKMRIEIEKTNVWRELFDGVQKKKEYEP